MDKAVLESQWIQAREYIRDRWSKLTEDDVRQINGRVDQLIDKLQQRYGYTSEQAEEEVRRWNMEKSARPTGYSSDRTYVRDERKPARREENSSILPWLLALALPLLLLGLYFGSPKASESTTAPAEYAEDVTVFAVTPADQNLGQSIRKAVLDNRAQLSNYKNISFTAENGVVTVNGNVRSSQERDLISSILRNINGVKQINNQIQVIR